ncbi:MAG TPA: glycosyltransferase [Salinivirgaceae bacterium]|nr:glycosyltransferase [Salinivirgaceae bacterium]
MLSVCIPVFNTDIRQLAKDLSQQTVRLGIDAEIRIYDDRSHIDYRRANRVVAGFERVIYNELQRNIGRSAIRNLMARESEGTAILFLDGDMQIVSDDFLKKYYDLHRNQSIVVGGIIYPAQPPGTSYMLRWKYGHQRESINADTRQLFPYRSFMTGNVMIPQKFILENPFDEEIVGYGHEDTHMGYQLRKMRYPILHIDNPTMHMGIESSSEFLYKTKIGIENLVALWHRLGYPKDFSSTVKLLKTACKTNKPIVKNLYLLFFSVFRKNMESNLLSHNPSLFIFDLYKLGLTLQALRKYKH